MLLGLDLGTSSVKALLLGMEEAPGSVIGESTIPYAVRSPHPGWAESDPGEWWEAVGRATREAVGPHGSDIAAVGLSGQMHGVVLCDGAGAPSRPAILWADSRSEEQLDAYRRLPEDAHRRLANPPAVGMAGPTLLWLRGNEPEVYGGTRWALQPKDWLRLRLTGEAASEHSDASATLLYDLPAGRWADDVIESLGLRSGRLAPLLPSGGVAGELDSKAAGHLGLPAGIPVAAGAADTAAAMLGSGLTRPGEAQLTVGTGGQIVVPTGSPEPDPNGRTHRFRTAAGAPFYAMAAVQNAGLALEWARRALGASWDDVYAEAFAVPAGSGGVTFLPYLSGERTPHFDPNARGAWSGLGLGHGRGHLLRAALEGVAFSLRDGLEALEAGGFDIPKMRLAGGGAVRESWRRLLAGALDRPLLMLLDTVAPIASARGAALLAGISTGTFRPEDLFSAPETVSVVYPGEDRDAYGEAYARYRKAYRGPGAV
jgi:xylulokinase